MLLSLPLDNKFNVSLIGAGCDRLPGVPLVVTAVFGAGLKIFPPNANAAASATQSKTTKAIATTGNFFTGSDAGVIPAFATAAGIGRSPTFVPVMINFESSVAGACGAVIFWKHVGHSITVPLCDESHFMCWPQIGHAYLNSLMAGGKVSHIRAPSATWFFYESRDISE
jgi:hypothetical protein